MADYYPLIARAISGLDPSAPGEQRRALYERARSALIAQLRSVQPPLTESEITRERLSLEEAVRKVESEAAQRARVARDAARANRGKPGETAATPATGASTSSASAALSGSRATASAASSRPARELRNTPPTPQAPRPPAQNPSDVTPRRDPPSTAGQTQSPGIRGFRDVTADADDLGRATAQANRAARKTYANVPSPTPEFDRLEPSMEDRGNDAGGYDYNDLTGDDAPRGAQQMPPVRTRPQPDRVADRKTERQKERDVRRRAGGGFPLKSAIALGVLMILVGVAFLWGPKAYSSLRAMLSSGPGTAVVDVPKDGASGPRPKIADRVGQPSEQLATVAQRVVLYDEDPAEPKGKQYVGTVVWRTEQMKASGNQPGDLAVRADIDIPERKFKMSMSFRRNTDTSLPASHTAELTFVLPADFTGGGVANVPGILMKSNEQARGTPLAGLAVKVTDGFFLVGLSNVETDRARNIQLLKERSWFDVPLVYTNQRRAIIAIEKGGPGERAFNDAFATWGE
ncbi:MAG: hypothetical protein JWQ51_1763 [Tardiphaga sp.]|nr:hypothetical protein [Tardiphaga sp.]